jgi:hypothetical protein
MPRAGFEPATPATKQPQTYALDRASTGIGGFAVIGSDICPFKNIIQITVFLYKLFIASNRYGGIFSSVNISQISSQFELS